MHYNFFGDGVSIVEIKPNAEMAWNCRPFSMDGLDLHIVASPWLDIGKDVGVFIAWQTDNAIGGQDQKDLSVHPRC